MKNKFKFLTKVSLKRKIKTKWFLIVNILLAIAIIAIANIDNIIKFFGGDFDTLIKIYVVDNTNISYDILEANLKENINLSFDDNKYEIIKSTEKDNVLNLIKTDEKDSILLVLNFDEDNILQGELISNDYIDTLDFNVISNSINNTKLFLAINKYQISEEEINALTSQVKIDRQILDDQKNSEEENMEVIMTAVFPVFILPIFMLTIFLVQMIGAEVNDEKTTKGMEIIISNVSPKVHFFSKCVASNLFVLIQGALLIFYVLLAFLSRNLFTSNNVNIITQLSTILSGIFTASFISSLKYLLPLMLVLIILTFIAYSLLAGILASMTTNTEDFQQIQTPIMLLNLLGYYLGIMAGTFKGSIFIKILGYVPFISSVLSPSLLVMGEFNIFDVFVSILLLIFTIFILIKYGLRIYKVGILNYSTGGLWKKMFKALKNKN